jgi:hypothetical protein
MAMIIGVATLSKNALIFVVRPIGVVQSMCCVKMFLPRYLYLHGSQITWFKIKGSLSGRAKIGVKRDKVIGKR